MLRKSGCACLLLLSALTAKAQVAIYSITPSRPSPQPMGTPITFTVLATDEFSGPVAFQFSVAAGGGAFHVVRSFNVGAFANGLWTSQAFSWTPGEHDGDYTIQVTAKDFNTGESATETVPYTFQSVVSGNALTVVPTANTLVGLAAVPPCPAGQAVRVAFSAQGSTAETKTPFVPCQAPQSSNVYLGGMYANTTYNVRYEIQSQGIGYDSSGSRRGHRYPAARIEPGATTTTFTTGDVPADITIPTMAVITDETDQADAPFGVALHGYINDEPNQNTQPTATDRNGNTMWYFPSQDLFTLLTRPLKGGHILLLQSSLVWDTGQLGIDQALDEVDLAGNVVKETNVGILQQQIAAMGATDLVPCAKIAVPVAVGSSCLTAFTHDAIQMPNGNWAALVSMEKIFPPGTQGDTSGLNVDILGDAIVVLDPELNVLWYWNSFQHAGGGTQLDSNRRAPLGETCVPGGGGCPLLLLYGTPGIAQPANDWMHSNSIFFDPRDGNFVISVRHQDWALKIDYANGAGTGNILWRMGVDGDFTFNNLDNDPFPWFSHQHDVGFESNGVLTLFDNGNTRIGTMGGNSRGYAFSVDEANLQVTPVFRQDLGDFAYAVGSAELLPNGNYFFQPGIVPEAPQSYSEEFVPGSDGLSGTAVWNLEAVQFSYRTFLMTDMYNPPTT